MSPVKPSARNVLFALSGNQCARPECTLPVTERRTVPVGEVCHIHPKRPGNPVHPRWNPDLSEDEINDISNLILLCRHHHRIVDRVEPELYSADLLRRWKNDHEEKNSAPQYGHSSASVVDKAIGNDLEEIKRGRFLQDFETTQRCLQLGTALTSGEYSAGTPAVRSRALAWCARILAPTDNVPRAKEHLQRAEELASGEEITIATALILSQEKGLQDALTVLAGVESPMARSAALGIVALKGTPEAAVEWLRDAGLEATDLDADGKTSLLACLLELGNWDRAKAVASLVTSRTGDNPPALDHVTALTHLLQTVPGELRDAVRAQVPTFAVDFPLASDSDALRSRRTARRHFRAASASAHDLDCPAAALVAEEYALWLELLDPEYRHAARMDLEIKVRDPGRHLPLVPLALQCEVEVDLEKIEQAIRRETAKHGGTTPATAAARLAVATTRGAPGAVADYISQHREDFAVHVDQTALGVLEVDALAQAGRVEQAGTRLDQLLEGGLSSPSADRLRARITKAEGENTTAFAKRRFEETDSLPDLLAVVGALSATSAETELCHYAEMLFRRTHSLEDAKRLASALAEAQEYGRLAEFLDANQDLVEQSETLMLFSCWSLFYQGSLVEAQARLRSLTGSRDRLNHRRLEVQLAVALGDWDSLSTLIESEYQARESRDWRDLAGTARLAAGLGLPRAKELASAAAEKAQDNAGALAGIYLLAVQAGWDDEPLVGTWFNQAVALSGTDGPFQKIDLPTLLSERPKWHARRASLLEQLERGEVPAFLAAGALHSSLSRLILLPALLNRSETDPRRRHSVSAYSGKRPPVPCNQSGEAGLDPTALLTLGLLDLLDETLDAFEAVHLPHSTLAWLFEEVQNASFHQPSRLREAHRISKLLSQGRVSRLEPTTSIDNELATQVGSELAMLIAEAEATHNASEQCFVVRPFPVHAVASLMEEEVDLTSHSHLLSSCLAIVDTLRADGILTDEQHRRAGWYLNGHEQPWPNQPTVSREATLYLDGLATTYFLHLDLLELLDDAGFTVFVTPGTVSEALDLLAYEDLSEQVHEILERVRKAVRARIVAGRVHFGPVVPEAVSDGTSTADPTMELFALTDRCDVIVTDDRFLNGYQYADGPGQSVPTISTLDILDMLASAETISAADRLTYRTRLRRFGYLFVPVEGEELSRHLLNSRADRDRVAETSELKAVRESVLVARTGHHLQLPDESQWLSATIGAFVAALKGLWLGDPDVSEARTRSDWILGQIDLRGWAHRLPSEGEIRTMEADRAEQLVRLLLPASDVTTEVREHYWAWVEARLLKPIRDTEPTLYSALAERFLVTVARVADNAAEKMEAEDE